MQPAIQGERICRQIARAEVTARVLVGAIAGALPGARLNLVHFVLLCDAAPSNANLRMCTAVDDPMASAVRETSAGPSLSTATKAIDCFVYDSSWHQEDASTVPPFLAEVEVVGMV